MKTDRGRESRKYWLFLFLFMCCIAVMTAVSPRSLYSAAAAAPHPKDTATPVTVLAAPTQMKVLRDANLRGGPGTTYAVIGKVRNGQTVSVTGCNRDCSWYQLDTGEWIAAFLVEKAQQHSETEASPAPTKASAGSSVKATPTPKTTEIALSAVAEDIAQNVGNIVTSVKGKADQIVLVFPEQHDSVAGQLEVAIMLNRLYERYGMKEMGLEGAVVEQGEYVSGDWFHFPPTFKAGDSVRAREDVVVQELEQGEISAMEMMALIYEDVKVSALESSKEYQVELSDDANTAIIEYLYWIAVPGLTNSEIQHANELVSQGMDIEAIEYIFSTEEFTQEVYERLSDVNTLSQCKEWVVLIDEIKQKADQAGAEITTEVAGNLDEARLFFETCDTRSLTMVQRLLALASNTSKPVAMSVGAAHVDKISDALRDSGVSFAVIEPASLKSNQKVGKLWPEAYARKLLGLSIDPAGALGPLLDNRKKPPPVIPEPWMHSSTELRLLTTLIARAYAAGEKPPFDSALTGVLPRLANVRLVPGSIQIVPDSRQTGADNVIFSVMAKDNNSQPVQIWVRTRVDQAASKGVLLEERLRTGLDDAVSKELGREPEQEPADPKLLRVSSDTVAKFSRDHDVILNTKLGG